MNKKTKLKRIIEHMVRKTIREMQGTHREATYIEQEVFYRLVDDGIDEEVVNNYWDDNLSKIHDNIKKYLHNTKMSTNEKIDKVYSFVSNDI